MAAKRPGYARYDTDHNALPMTNMDNHGESSDSKKDWKNDDAESLKGARAKVTGVDSRGSLPAFEPEVEDKFGQGDVVTTVSRTGRPVIYRFSPCLPSQASPYTANSLH